MAGISDKQSEQAGDDPSSAEGGFAFSSEAEVPRRVNGYYRKPRLEDYEAVYGTVGRTIKRWVKIGKNKGKLPPLDEPVQMVGWWGECMRNKCPDSILLAARKDEGRGTRVEGETEPVAATVAATSSAMVLESMSLEEGEEVRQARGLVAAAYKRLEEAYAKGHAVELLQRNYASALESMRKIQAADREVQKAAGQLVSRVAVEGDIEEATEMLQMMRENMVRRVMEKLPAVDQEILEKIERAILEVRAREDLVFQNLPSLAQAREMLIAA